MKQLITSILFFIGAFLLVSNTISTHDPLSASFTLTENEDFWVIDVNTSYTGLNNALKKTYTNVNFVTIQPKEYKELAFKYVKENISIIANDGVQTTLQSGGIRLGSHQTDLKLVVKDLPESVYKMEIKIPCFTISKNHQSVLKIKPVKDDLKKIILNEGNKYTAIFLNDVGVFYK